MKITLDEFATVIMKNACADTNFKEIKLDDHLGDIGIDSLGFVCLIWDIEDTFKINVDDEYLEHLNNASTVSDLISMFDECGLTISI